MYNVNVFYTLVLSLLSNIKNCHQYQKYIFAGSKFIIYCNRYGLPDIS